MTTPQFIDEAQIEVWAGNGGDGAVSFRREAHVAMGGPDGGDGGKGGDIIIRADHNIVSLAKFRSKKQHKAQRGQDGMGKQMTGAMGDDLTLLVPVGTQIRNEDKELLADLCKHNQEFVVAEGGNGGLGNTRFKSSTNRAPRKATPGKEGDYLFLNLELAILADVGFVGFPNAGKSTLLSALTNATPAIAGYPFTTLTPQLGICDLDTERTLLLADMPGLIEGAAQGVGLGHTFLRHIRRTQVLIFVLSQEYPIDELVTQYQQLVHELVEFDESLGKKHRVLALSKADLVLKEEAEESVALIRSALQADIESGTIIDVLSASAVTKLGLNEVKESMWQCVQQPLANETPNIEIPDWHPLEVS